MSDRPILFNAEMVRAILDGRKSQTRRPIKPQPPGIVTSAEPWRDGLWRIEHEPTSAPIGEYVGMRLRCPFGEPGGLLWVRETFMYHPRGEGYIKYKSDGSIYVKTDYGGLCKVPDIGGYELPHWRPSIHMPRWASRLTLRVKRVWVERVQDITEEDAIAEGLRSFTYNYTRGGKSNPRRVYQAFPDKDGGFPRATQALEALWNSIYAAKGFGWDTNPYVWACEFEKENHEQNGN